MVSGAGSASRVKQMIGGGQGAASERLNAYLMIIPAVLLVSLFTLYPYAYALWSSVRRMSPILPPDFVGFRNYSAVITSTYFLGAVQNTLIFTVISVPIIVVLGIASASILNQKFLGDILLKPIVLLPWTIPAAVSGVIWKGMFSDSWGAINAVLYSLHLIPKYIPWLNKANLSMFAVIVAQVWTQLPFAIVLTLAAMQAIPHVLYESAAIDGASAWGRFRHITMPNIRAMLVIVTLYEILMGLTTFDLTYSLTGGGPGTSTTLISYFTWAESFKMLSFGRGAALAIVIALTSLIFILGILQALPKDALLGGAQE